MRPLPILLLIAVSLLGLLLAGCVQDRPSAPGPSGPVVTEPAPAPAPPAPAEPSAPANPCSGGSVIQNDDCFKAYAQSQSDIAWCERIYSLDTRDQCLAPFGAQRPEACERMSGGAMRQDCYDRAARALKDRDLCVKITDAARKQACLKDLSPPCSFEKDDEATALCLALEGRNSSLCVSDDCRFEYAAQSGDAEACDPMDPSAKARKLACVAVATRQTAACLAGNVSAPVSDYCYQLAALRLNDSYWCSKATADGPYQVECTTHFAILSRDAQVCERIGFEFRRDDCYVNYSIATDRPEVCPLVVNTLNRAKCFIKTALQNADMVACNGLMRADKNSCYNLVINGEAPLRGGLEGCAAVDNALWRDKCYDRLAAQDRDPSACAFISDESVAAACRGKAS